jgi:hypothetical protein
VSQRRQAPEPTTTRQSTPHARRGRRILGRLALGSGGLAVVAMGAFAGFWVFMRLSFGLTVSDQPMAVTLPERFDITAQIAEELDILMEGIITAQVPFQQELTLPLKGRYRSHITMNADVPVQFDVVYDGIIPVDTVADIQIRTDFNYMGAKTLRNLDIRAKLPMQFRLPVQLTAPVDDRIKLRYDGPLVMNLDQTITTEVDTIIDTQLDVHERVSAPVIASIPMRTIGPAQPLRTTITRLPISGLVRDIGLSVTENPERPQRSESVWGPAGVPMAERPVAPGRELPGEATDRR